MEEDSHPRLEQEFGNALDAISDQASMLTALADKIVKDLSTDESESRQGDMKSKNNGLSYLDVKNLLLLNYNCDLVGVMSAKCDGRSLVDHPAVDRLIETRTVLEKTRGIDQKLKYQIDKLVRAANFTSQTGAADPLGFRANLDNFEEDDEDEAAGTGNSKPGVYKPPKLGAVRYDGDDTEADRKEKREKMRQKAIANASIIKDLDLDREEPEEIFENHLHRFKEDKQLTERTKYEEENLTRLTITKKDKARMKRIATTTSMGDVLTNFSDSRALWETEDDADDARRRQKSKKTDEGRGKKRKLTKTAAKKIKSKKKKRFN